ncbi:hypothetical protein AKO1_013879, partial [Acrasis kona]
HVLFSDPRHQVRLEVLPGLHNILKSHHYHSLVEYRQASTTPREIADKIEMCVEHDSSQQVRFEAIKVFTLIINQFPNVVPHEHYLCVLSNHTSDKDRNIRQYCMEELLYSTYHNKIDIALSRFKDCDIGIVQCAREMLKICLINEPDTEAVIERIMRSKENWPVTRCVVEQYLNEKL